jgi:hypothetical protein
MCIDQARYQRVLPVLVLETGRVAVPCGLGWQDVDDTVFVYGDTVIGQAGIACTDGNYPAGMQQGIDIGHAAKIPAVMAVRKGGNYVMQFMLFFADSDIKTR